eukprot:scaffold114019_cov31-Tisochrysis_lutea.AAC.1
MASAAPSARIRPPLTSDADELLTPTVSIAAAPHACSAGAAIGEPGARRRPPDSLLFSSPFTYVSFIHTSSLS